MKFSRISTISLSVFVSFFAFGFSPPSHAAEKTTVKRAPADQLTSQQEADGADALKALGFAPENFNSRQKREAGLLRKYQNAWNVFDASVTDFSKVANPELIMSFYADGKEILYRDLCVPQGLKNKSYFGQYLSALYQKFPRQIWGNGWSKIHLFVGSKPGEWSYYYNFSMYRGDAVNGEAAYSGTGMERVQFDSDGKLLSDEVHLILDTGVANCKSNAG